MIYKTSTGALIGVELVRQLVQLVQVLPTLSLTKNYPRLNWTSGGRISLELKRRLDCLDSSVQAQLDDLVEKVWGEISDFSQQEKEKILVLLIDKVFQ